MLDSKKEIFIFYLKDDSVHIKVKAPWYATRGGALPGGLSDKGNLRCIQEAVISSKTSLTGSRRPGNWTGITSLVKGGRTTYSPSSRE